MRLRANAPVLAQPLHARVYFSRPPWGPEPLVRVRDLRPGAFLEQFRSGAAVSFDQRVDASGSCSEEAGDLGLFR